MVKKVKNTNDVFEGIQTELNSLMKSNKKRKSALDKLLKSI